jgi:hypothetical protein
MQVSGGPTVFSAETNPLLREMAKKKKGGLMDILGQLSGMGAEGGEEEDLASFLGKAAQGKGGAPVYDPNKYYGGMYSMYGGRKVRGGLLGD